MGKLLDKMLHEFTIVVLAAIFILLAYLTWTVLLPWLRAGG